MARLGLILGDPGAISGWGRGKVVTGEKKFRRRKVKYFTFLRRNFFSPVTTFPRPHPLTAPGSPRMLWPVFITNFAENLLFEV